MTETLEQIALRIAIDIGLWDHHNKPATPPLYKLPEEDTP